MHELAPYSVKGSRILLEMLSLRSQPAMKAVMVLCTPIVQSTAIHNRDDDHDDER